MAVFRLGLMSVKLRYCWQKKGSPLLYYRRRVPPDLREKVGLEHVVRSLGTTDPKAAAVLIARWAKKDDDDWQALRNPSRSGNLRLAQELLTTAQLDPVAPEEGALWAFHDVLEEQLVEGQLQEPHKTALELLKGTRAFTLGDCLDQYITARPNDSQRATRAFRYLTEFLGRDKDMRDVRRTDVNGFVQHLLAKDMSTTTVQRYVTPIKAAFGRAIRENEYKIANVFAKVEIPDFGEDAEDREVFTLEQLKVLRTAIAEHGLDTLRAILLVVAETGARLAEIVGLAKADLHLKAETPFIQLKPHPWRTLKTPGSTRKIPLTERAVEALQASIRASSDPVVLYPRYVSAEGSKAATASAALVKWIRVRLPGTELGCHSLRHGIKDRLRAVGCPSEASDQLLGHVTPGMGARYGEGYPLEQLRDWLNSATNY